MYPKQHLFFGILLIIFLFILHPEMGIIGISIILFSTLLIDIDHYIYYIYKKKYWSLINAYNFFNNKIKKVSSFPREKRNNLYVGFYFLHGFEIAFIMILLSYFSKYFLFAFVGISFHLLLDIVVQTTYWDRLDKISLIYDYLKFRNGKYISLS